MRASLYDPQNASSLVDVLRGRAQQQPEARAYCFLSDGEASEASLSYAEIDAAARVLAGALQQRNAAGARALLLFPPGVAYVTSFFGCLYAGAIAVPVYPPDPARFARLLPRLEAIVKDAGVRFVITTSLVREALRQLGGRGTQYLVDLEWLCVDELDPKLGDIWHKPRADAANVAFLQYTSGSTGAPKGVIVTHDNLLHNLAYIRNAFELWPGSSVMSWLPPYHDMGLIGGILAPIFAGVPVVAMAPFHFLERPRRWLEAISKYRITISGGPNFAYDLCVRKASGVQTPELSLETWNVAFNGAEPIRAATLERFSAAFQRAGFSKRAFYPCYGLAEGTLMVSGGRKGAGHRTLDAADGAHRSLVGCGSAAPDQRLAIVSPDTRRVLAEGGTGEIWVQGRSVAAGYWNQPELTEEVFGATATALDGRWLRTGDLGSVIDGELVIAGRCKDVLIVRGRNHYPQDIEETLDRCHPAVRAGCGAAFSVEVDEQERLVIAQEIDPAKAASASEVIASIRRSVLREHEIEPHAVVLLKRSSIPKTSSGKIQRSACRDAFLRETLDAIEVHKTQLDPALPTSVAARIREITAAGLRMPSSELPLDVPLVELGIDSLASFDLADELSRELSVDVSMQMVLTSSVRALSEQLASLSKSDPSTPSAGGPDHSQTPLALSAAQRGIWFLCQLDGDSRAYNIGGHARIRGPLAPRTLAAALEGVVRRHQALWTTFDAVDGIPHQRPGRPDFTLQQTDASGWSAERTGLLLRDETSAPFDLRSGPLFRARLIQVGVDEHVLVLAAHHLIADGWSFKVILEELCAFYALLRGEATAGPVPLQASYAALTLQRGAHAELRERQTRAWAERLSGALLSVELHGRRRLDTSESSGRVSLNLPAEVVQRVQELSKKAATTPYAVLLSALSLVLKRHSGQSEVVIGSPVINRPSAAHRAAVGCFVSVLPLRVQFDPAVTFRGLLAEVSATVRAAQEHDEVSLERLVQLLQSEQATKRSLPFNVMFAAGVPLPSSQCGDCQVVAVERMDLTTPMFDLVVSVDLGPSQWLMSWDYREDFTDREMVATLCEHFVGGLTAALNQLDAPTDGLSLMNDDECAAVVVTGHEEPPTTCLHSIFEKRAAENPSATALIDGDRRLSYRDLDASSSKLACLLRSRGVGPDDRVGLSLHPSLETVVGILGIWKAGAAYVPLDPIHPDERLFFMLEDSGAKLVLVSSALAERFAGCSVETVTIDRPFEEPLEQGSQETLAPEHLAYVMYTSGSTGRPKGVMITHANVVRFFTAVQPLFEFSSRDVWSQFHSYGFDISVWEVCGALLHGGTLLTIPHHVARAPDEFYDLISRHGVTILSQTPSAWRELDRVDQARRKSLALRTIAFVGEKLDFDLLSGWVDRHGDEQPRLVNMYGPTEATIFAMYRRVRTAEVRSSRGSMIGRPLSDVGAAVVDDLGAPCPIGVPGEIVLIGPTVGRGYLGRPELDAKSFVTFEHGTRPGQRAYRTGDRGRVLPDGDFEYLGRFDHQVKIRGYRVELGEIEAALRGHPLVRESVVLAKPAGDGATRLVAYVIAAQEETAFEEQLRSHLACSLPAYMIPSDIVFLGQFPLTPSRKIDWRALPEPSHERTGGAPCVAARSDLERTLSTIVAEVLGRSTIGVFDRFFEQGGDSLGAVQVVARASRIFGVTIPVRAFLDEATVAAFALAIERGRAAWPAPTGLHDAQGRASAAIPMTAAQAAQWRVHRPGRTGIMPLALELQGSVDVSKLEQAACWLVDRHEAMRTRIQEASGTPMQLVDPPGSPLSWVFEDLQATPERAPDKLRDLLLQPFDLRSQRPIRFNLLQCGAERYLLGVAIHHIFCDLPSLHTMFREFFETYAKLSNGAVVSSQKPPFEYRDFVLWQRDWIASNEAERQLAFWRERLDGAVPLRLPRRPPDGVAERPCAVATHVLPQHTLKTLRRFAERNACSLFMVLVTALKTALREATGELDLLIAAPISGRTREEFESMVGLLRNYSLIRTDFSGTSSFEQRLLRVRESTLSAYAHQDIPFEALEEHLHLPRPYFNVICNMYHPFAFPEVPGLRVTSQGPPPHRSQRAISIRIEEKDDLQIVVTGHADLADQVSPSQLLESMVSTLLQLQEPARLELDQP